MLTVDFLQDMPCKEADIFFLSAGVKPPASFVQINSFGSTYTMQLNTSYQLNCIYFYSFTDHRFVAPVRGLYMLTLSALVVQDYTPVSIYVNGNRRLVTQDEDYGGTSVSALLMLEAGDVATGVKDRSEGEVNGNQYTSFAGFLYAQL